RIRGTIEAIDGSMLTVKSREGNTLKVKVADDTNIQAMVPAALADIKPNSFVGATAMPEDNGRWRAIEVHLFPETMRGTGEGDRAFDYRPTSTMTNGTVGAVSKATMGGAVEMKQGTTLTLKYKGGEKQVDVTPQTVIYTYAAGDKNELKPGAVIFVSAATRQSDGTLTTARLNVARGVVPPM
ncbi:MAG: hypothetical protein JO237_05535, partial [Pseudolabrys sp.]|nr:hypothetical protein [Pseudolabrys sp.]